MASVPSPLGRLHPAPAGVRSVDSVLRADPGLARGRHRSLFLIHDLQTGGAERAFIHYLNHARRLSPIGLVLDRRLDLLGEVDPAVPMLDLATVRDGFWSYGGRLPAPREMRTPSWLARVFSGQIPLSLLGAALRLRGLARRTEAWIVSTFLPRSHLVGTMAALMEPRIRLVINVHEVVSDPATYLHPPVDRMLLGWFTRRYYRRAALVVAVSHGVRDDLVERFSVPPGRIAVLPGPLDLTAIRRSAAAPAALPWTSDPDRPLVVAVGRLVPLKGFDLLIEAFADLRHRAARLLIVGDGEERGRLEALIRERGLGDRIALLGHRANPWKYVARADLFVLPSRTEAFPTVVGEALALRVPVLAAACSPGVREYLRGGRVGRLVPPGDVGALRDGIDGLLSDPAARKRLALRGPERVRELGLGPAVSAYEAALLRRAGPAGAGDAADPPPAVSPRRAGSES